MKIPRFLLVPSLAFFPLTAFADEAGDALLDAATKGDAPRIVLALSEASPDSRDKQGRPPLMLAAKSGDFESVRRLLWGKADANLKDNQGKIARDYLDPKGEAFAPPDPHSPLLLLLSGIWTSRRQDPHPSSHPHQ